MYASASEDGESDGVEEGMKKRARLTDDEVLGNMFVIMVAGHGAQRLVRFVPQGKLTPLKPCTETTAHVLAFTLQYLALYQEEQKALLAHIDEVMPAGAEPVSHWSLVARCTSY